MLDLVQQALIAEGIPFVRLDGKTTAANRLAAIRAFAGTQRVGVSYGTHSGVVRDL